jgi:undecaprenyl phosphate-alpha-L-ara4N flippase subunit ArnE
MSGPALPVGTAATLTPVLFVALLLGSLCAAGGTFLIKTGATGNVTFAEFVNIRVLSGLALYGLGSAVWIFCMSRAPLSVVYPFTALTFVLVMLSAYTFLGERPGTAEMVGAGLILCGIASIAWGAMSWS